MIDYLSAFMPNSSGDYNVKSHMAYRGAGRLASQLVTLASVCGVKFTDEVDVSYFGQQPTEIGNLFNKYGSDKAESHDYDIVYDKIVRKDMKTIFEIGLGTNNEDVLSNMTRQGNPGASLKAFKEYLPDANIYGADIDERILFEEERISTFYVDQLDVSTLFALYDKFSNKIDLIIDDGLHSPEANLNVLAWGLSMLADDGWLVIEDIHEPALDVWRSAGFLIPPDTFESYIVKARMGYLFLVHKVV